MFDKVSYFHLLLSRIPAQTQYLRYRSDTIIIAKGQHNKTRDLNYKNKNSTLQPKRS